MHIICMLYAYNMHGICILCAYYMNVIVYGFGTCFFVWKHNGLYIRISYIYSESIIFLYCLLIDQLNPTSSEVISIFDFVHHLRLLQAPHHVLWMSSISGFFSLAALFRAASQAVTLLPLSSHAASEEAQAIPDSFHPSSSAAARGLAMTQRTTKRTTGATCLMLPQLRPPGTEGWRKRTNDVRLQVLTEPALSCELIWYVYDVQRVQ